MIVTYTESELLKLLSRNEHSLEFPTKLKLVELTTDGTGLARIMTLLKEKKYATDLLELDLSENKLTELQPNTFLGLDNLTVLNLSKNQLFGLPKDIFNPLVKLENLNLSGNELEQLDLSEDKLRSPQPNLFSPLISIQFLNLSDNLLTKIPDNICTLPTLKSLNLSKNQIQSLPEEEYWLNMTSLENLDLSFNRLKGNINALGALILHRNEGKAGLSKDEFESSLDEIPININIESNEFKYSDSTITVLKQHLNNQRKNYVFRTNEGLNFPKTLKPYGSKIAMTHGCVWEENKYYPSKFDDMFFFQNSLALQIDAIIGRIDSQYKGRPSEAIADLRLVQSEFARARSDAEYAPLSSEVIKEMEECTMRLSMFGETLKEREALRSLNLFYCFKIAISKYDTTMPFDYNITKMVDEAFLGKTPSSSV